MPWDRDDGVPEEWKLRAYWAALSANEREQLRKMWVPSKGNPAIFGDRMDASFAEAREYLELSLRQVQKLVKAEALDVIGEGRYNKRITVASLHRYLPPKKIAN